MEESKTKTIGVIGADHGVGATGIAIAMATYLSEIKKSRVAILEMGGNRTVQKLSAISGVEMKDNGCFRLKGIDYYENSSLLNLLNNTYDYIIMDIEEINDRAVEEFVKCTYKLFVGSLQLWKREMCLKQIERFRNISGSDGWLYIIHGSYKEVCKLSKEKRIDMVHMPFIEDSMKVSDISLEFFEKII
ncbi:MAG: hypothetical protein IIX45_01365 [Lachnospiraceae bacterium]|nr:hypothetical protein [Lachnospiraceae bacterium]